MRLTIPASTRHFIVWLAGCLAVAALVVPSPARAATTAPVGSRNVAIADPAVPRPGTTPCTVILFPSEDFGGHGGNTRMDAIPHPFNYAPPKACPGPWSKVVLVAHFSVDAGRQYDRTVSFWLNGVNLYFGTTEEPQAHVAPHWKVARDLTDYSALFRKPGKGVALINNWIDTTDTSVIHATAKLLFYPADKAYPAPAVPNKVYGLNKPGAVPANLIRGKQRLAAEGKAQQTTDLPNQMQALTRSITFPRNTSRVYVDIIAQPQFRDEFYYQCLPDDLRSHTVGFAAHHAYTKHKKPRACGGGNFREVLVSIDGQRAGLAPVVPWIYTGGVDPYLWRPTPGNETLNFMPYRVDLTPFAGLLSNGKPHQVSVKVVGVNNFFAVSGAVLVYQDEAARHTGGAVTHNSLQNLKLVPTVTSTLGQQASAGVNGAVSTLASQDYTIKGYVETPAGRVSHTVHGTLGIRNRQSFATAAGNGAFRHVTNQVVNVRTMSSAHGGQSAERTLRRNMRFALSLDIMRNTRDTAPSQRGRAVTVHQRFRRDVVQSQHGLPLYESHTENAHIGSDHIVFHSTKPVTYGHDGQTSEQTYAYWNTLGDCYFKQVRARGSAVTGSTRGTGCVGGKTALHWFVHPDGSPDSFGWRAH